MSGFFGKVIDIDDGYIGTLNTGAILLEPSTSNPIPAGSSGIFFSDDGDLTVAAPDVAPSIIVIEQSLNLTLDSYVDDLTFQQNKDAQNEINHHILIALDGYTTAVSSGVSEQTFQENKDAQGEINHQIIVALDGYGTAVQGTATQLAYFSGTNTLTSDTNLSFDAVNNRLVTYSIQITGGPPNDGYVLTSDANGVGTWQRPITGWPANKILTVDATHPAADFTTIQGAIDNANDGYIILVSPGTYSEQINLRAGITMEIRGTGPDYSSSVLSRTLSADGYVVNGPDSGAGSIIFKNMNINLTYNGISGSTAAILARSPSYGWTFKDCYINTSTQSALGGQAHAVLANASSLMEFFNCEIVADDFDGINNVEAIRQAAATITLDNTTVYGVNNYAIHVDDPAASLYISNSEIVGIVNVQHVSNVILNRASTITSFVGTITDDDQETQLTHNIYGVGLTSGANDFYKLHLRELGGDVTTPGDGQIWYNRAAGRFRMKEGGTVKDMIPYAALDGYSTDSVSEQTFQENKNAQDQINQSVRQALDAYGAASADTILFKSGDQSISAAGFVDITDLTFAVDASANYLIEAFVIFQSSATTMGVRFAVNGPASPTLLFLRSQKMVTVPGTASTDMFSDAALTAYDTPLPASTAEPANNTNLLWEAKGIFMNGSNSGTFALRFDKENVAGTATIKAGSFLKYKKL